jgi:hypothetical protein
MMRASGTIDTRQKNGNKGKLEKYSHRGNKRLGTLKESTPILSTKCDPHNINGGYTSLGTKIKPCKDPLLLWQGVPQPNQPSHLHFSITSDTRLQDQQSVAPEYTKTKHIIDFETTEVLADIKTYHLHLIKIVKLPHD